MALSGLLLRQSLPKLFQNRLSSSFRDKKTNQARLFLFPFTAIFFADDLFLGSSVFFLAGAAVFAMARLAGDFFLVAFFAIGAGFARSLLRLSRRIFFKSASKSISSSRVGSVAEEGARRLRLIANAEKSATTDNGPMVIANVCSEY